MEVERRSRTRKKMTKSRKKARRQYLIKKYTKYLIPALLYLASFIGSVAAGVLSTMPKTVSYEVGMVSEEDIVASKDIIDEYSTELLREEARQKVLPIYYVDESVLVQTEENLLSVFSLLEQTRQTCQTYYREQHENAAMASYVGIDWETELADKIGEIMEKLPDYITAQNVYTIGSMRAAKLEQMRQKVVELSREKLKNGLLGEDVQKAIEEIRTSFVNDDNYSTEESNLANNIVSNVLVANKFYNKEATDIAKNIAAEQVEEIRYKKGQNIVRQGEIITETQYQLIRQMGLVGESSHIFGRWIAGVIILLPVFIAGAIYAIRIDRPLFEEGKTMLQVLTLILMTIVIAVISRRIDQRLCLVFIVVIVAAVVFERKTAMYLGVFLSFIHAYILSPGDVLFFDEKILRQLTAGILGSLSVVIVLEQKQKRSEYILAGFIAGIITLLTYIGYGITFNFTLREFFTNSVYAVMNGLFSGFLAIGILPLWETVFSVVTPTKLLELTNPSRPLLRRLMVEAPGSYHHSIMVANLAEAGAEAIGADALLTRVAALYHDVGKLSDPVMFKENQINIPNPHDLLTPKESAEIIKKHVLDSVKFASQERLPKKAIDIISQHHGDSVVGYFYYMAKQQGDVNIDDFRYPAKKPQTKEAGVLMMADITEAAIRARKAASDADLDKQIADLIKGKYDEGEFDECPITRRDINAIVKAFVSIYEGARHERILYPQDKERELQKEKELKAAEENKTDETAAEGIAGADSETVTEGTDRKDDFLSLTIENPKASEVTEDVIETREEKSLVEEARALETQKEDKDE